jgi:hypothetical protein
MGAKKKSKGRSGQAEQPVEAGENGMAAKREDAPRTTKALVPARRGKRGGPPPESAEKAKFVASFPATTPATEIAAAARKKGMTMSEKFIYKLRAKAKARPAFPGAAANGAAKAKAKAKPNGSAKKTPRPTTPRATQVPTSGSYEAVFARAVVDMGFDQAQVVLTRVRDRLLRAAEP